MTTTHSFLPPESPSIYVIGGYGARTHILSNTEIYREGLGWREGPVLPHRCERPSACAIPGIGFYVLGESLRVKHVTKEIEAFVGVLQLNFDPSGPLEWVERARLHLNSCHGADVACLNEKLYRAGGVGLEGNRTYMYDPDIDEWENSINLPEPYIMTLSSLPSFNCMIGVAPDTGAVLQLDPRMPCWLRRSSLPSPREAPASVTFSDSVLLLGGGQAEVLSYDLRCDAWHTHSLAPSLYGMCAASLGTESVLCLGGGSIGEGGEERAHNDVYVWRETIRNDDQECKWVKDRPLRTARIHSAADTI
jgi:hypothetical protein